MPMRPFTASRTQLTLGYWFEPMSTMSLLRSYCTGRVGSKAFTDA